MQIRQQNAALGAASAGIGAFLLCSVCFTWTMLLTVQHLTH